MEIVKSWQTCIGTISDENESWDIRCEVQCSSTGQLSVLLDDVPLNDTTFRLYDAANGSNLAVLSYLKLDCVAPDGTRLISDHTYITELGLPYNAEGSWVHLRGKAARLEAMISPCDSASKATLRYHTLGMLGFSAIKKEYGDLILKVEAPHEVQDFDSMSGTVWMQGRNIEALNAWVAERDRNAETLLRVISFGQGRIVHWTVRELWVNDALSSILFVGPNSSPVGLEPPFSHLHMEPLIDLAASRFDTGLDQPRNMSIAMEWLAISSTYSEVKLLNAAAAFESLLAGNDEDGAMLPLEVFQSVIRAPIETLLSGDSMGNSLKERVQNLSLEAANDILAAIKVKLGDLNRRTFRDRLSAFLARFDVPLADLPLSVHKLLQTRNKIVHGGENPHPKYSIAEQALMMREVLRRTILAMLSFEGQFCSYIHGPEWLTFRAPPTTAA
jgi:hypothetical protein